MANSDFQIEGTAFNSFSILDKIPKLPDNEGDLNWKREITKLFKMIKLWTLIQLPNGSGLVARKLAWRSWHKLMCNLLWYLINENAFNEIEHNTDPLDEWNFLELILKPWSAGFFNDALKRLDCRRLINYKSPAKYISQFWGIVDEQPSFSFKFKLDVNFLIYPFQSNLGL